MNPARAPAKLREALATAVSERDPALAGHSDQVAELAVQVARRMRLGRDETQVIRHAAALHDVGKLALPPHILEKPGPLDPDEWEQMRNHTIVGAQMISAAPGLAPVAELVRCSHERFDGDGYPDGLRGEEIPLGSRIIFACDAFAAMTCWRPYRTAMSREEALAELRRCAGTQFDPFVAEVLCGVIEGEPSLGFGLRRALARARRSGATLAEPTSPASPG
jgi:two-component system, cell cycle response regulator